MEIQSFDTPGALTVQLKVPAGDIAVHARDARTTELSIEGAKRPEDYVVRFDDLADGGHRLLVEYRGRKIGFSFRSEVRITIDCPLGTSVESESGSADVVARGRLGSIAARTGSGDLSFDEVEGAITVKCASGDVEGGTVGGSFVMNAASGDVRLTHVAGDLVMKAVSGDLEAGSVGGDVTVNTVSGDVDLGTVHRGVTAISSVSGDVKVGVAPGTSVLLDLNAATGDATSDLDLGGGAQGQAQLELRVNTVSGDIRVLRARSRALETDAG
jgi:DUF4097 and DUF4098 domain-containing protein YvlB